jgi:Uma2 family endonuclease
MDEHNVYEPGVVYLVPHSRCIEEEKRLTGAPDLVVEVLSPGTAKHDHEKKFNAYQAHGMGEYWVADPANAYLEVWQLRDGFLPSWARSSRGIRLRLSF